MNDPVAALKGRRRGSGKTTPASTGPTVEDAMTSFGTRGNPVLFDPAEMPVVVESGGHVPPANLDEHYIVAEVDGTRWVTPEGCRTPVAQSMWLTGQQVRRDVYLMYLKEIGHPLPEAYRHLEGGIATTTTDGDKAGGGSE